MTALTDPAGCLGPVAVVLAVAVTGYNLGDNSSFFWVIEPAPF